MNEIIKQYSTKNFLLTYLKDQNNRCSFAITKHDVKIANLQNMIIDPLVHVFLTGDIYNGGFVNGLSMRYSSTTKSLVFAEQKFDDKSKTVITKLTNGKGLFIKHYCEIGDEVLTCHAELENSGTEDVIVEMLSTFSFNIVADEEIDDEKIKLHRLQSSWSDENRFTSQCLTDLNMEASWSGSGFRSIRYGSVGSLPIRRYYPFISIENEQSGCTFSAILSAPYSWELEVSRNKNKEISISGGMGDYEFAHHSELVKVGSILKSPMAFLTMSELGVDESLRVFNRYLNSIEKSTPKSEEDLPIIYNEFCYTWGNPEAEKIKALVDKIQDWGIKYFVIDAGWYQGDDGSWGTNMGDWNTSKALFPNGIKEVSEYIQSKNMISGIWFELETVGIKANIARDKKDWFLKRNNHNIQSGTRLFWDMSNKDVNTYLDEKIIQFLKENNFGYMKVDYNESIGIGCDGEISLGAGLRKNIINAQSYYKKICSEIPDLVLEICASGGHRNEASFINLASMNSFSDAHECLSIPIIVANVGMTLPAKQNQIWCVLQSKDDKKRMIYSLCASFLGRMCLSGDLCKLDVWQDDLIKEGISFYEKIKPVIKNGDQYIHRNYGKSYSKPTGSQVVVRKNNEFELIVAHAFENPKTVEVKIENNFEILANFGENDIEIQGNLIVFKPRKDFSASAIFLKYKNKESYYGKN